MKLPNYSWLGHNPLGFTKRDATWNLSKSSLAVPGKGLFNNINVGTTLAIVKVMGISISIGSGEMFY